MDLEALEAQARGQLDRGLYDYFAGGADDELTLADNVAAWSRLRLRPRVLRDVSQVSTATSVLGRTLATPIIGAPVAYQRLLHPDGEIATMRGLAEAGSLMVVSTRSSCALAEVAGAVDDPSWWFQVYVMRDRRWTEELVHRAVAAGVAALVLTVDTPALGRRRRDERNNFTLPQGVSMGNLPLGVAREGINVEDAFYQSPSVTPDDVGWLAELSPVPLVAKGVLRGDEAVRCLDAGATAIAVSNHGGRQLDGVVATADALVEVVEAVDGRAEVYVDGGVRRGTDVLKALAMGARAVMVGRPLMWGLSTDGDRGVAAVLNSLREELQAAMTLCGSARVEDLSADLVLSR